MRDQCPKEKLTGFHDNDALPQVETIGDNADVAQDRRVQYSAGDRLRLLDHVERDDADANAFEHHSNEQGKPATEMELEEWVDNEKKQDSACHGPGPHPDPLQASEAIILPEQREQASEHNGVDARVKHAPHHRPVRWRENKVGDGARKG